MANDQTVGELERFLAERGDRLMRTAVLLTVPRLWLVRVRLVLAV
jgi:hypothetical protein